MDTLLAKLLSRFSTDNEIIITAGTTYTHTGEGCFMYVPVAGVVHYKTAGGQENTLFLTAGYHPKRVVKIFSDSAVTVSLNW